VRPGFRWRLNPIATEPVTTARELAMKDPQAFDDLIEALSSGAGPLKEGRAWREAERVLGLLARGGIGIPGSESCCGVS
jgi:hypothetical protein